MKDVKYAIVSPAKNEQDYIERTIKSVIDQTILPQKWVIISDGSTDRTDEIVRGYAKDHPWLELLRREPDPSRNFGSKVFAIRAGMERMAGVEYDFIGNLDADISFQKDYFELLLGRMIAEPALGIAGGLIHDNLDNKWTPLFLEPEWAVSGAVQMFRREAYEKIGGYTPLPRGGIDAAAEFMVRMNGWRVRTFKDLEVRHYRRAGTSKGGILHARYRQGVHEFTLGYHPLFELARCVSRLRQRPYVVGSLWRYSGYVSSAIKRLPHVLPDDVVKHVHKEQLGRLRDRLSGRDGKR